MSNPGKIQTWLTVGALTVLGALVVTRIAYAGGSVSGTKIEEVSANGTVAWIKVTSDITGTRASCHTASNKRELVFIPTTDWGKAFLTLAQAARHSGRLVDVAGGSTCLDINTTPVETLSMLKVRN
jgi:hypothetical protein